MGWRNGEKNVKEISSTCLCCYIIMEVRHRNTCILTSAAQTPPAYLLCLAHPIKTLFWATSLNVSVAGRTAVAHEIVSEWVYEFSWICIFTYPIKKTEAKREERKRRILWNIIYNGSDRWYTDVMRAGCHGSEAKAWKKWGHMLEMPHTHRNCSAAFYYWKLKLSIKIQWYFLSA